MRSLTTWICALLGSESALEAMLPRKVLAVERQAIRRSAAEVFGNS